MRKYKRSIDYFAASPSHAWICRKKRKQLTDYARVFAQHPYDRQVRDHFFKLRKEYSKSTKLESRKYKQDLLHKIETLHENDPKKYWDLINKLRNKKDDNTNNTITPSAWIRHFSELSQEKEVFKARHWEAPAWLIATPVRRPVN